MPNKWEIWLVSMPFEDVQEAKPRPALVLDPEGGLILVGKMTSHAPRTEFPMEYALEEWQGAGLSVPTTLRLSQRVRLGQDRFLKKMGIMQKKDMVTVSMMLKKLEHAHAPE